MFRFPHPQLREHCRWKDCERQRDRERERQNQRGIQREKHPAKEKHGEELAGKTEVKMHRNSEKMFTVKCLPKQ